MLEELIEAGVQLPEREVITVDIMSDDQFSETFTAVSPNQKIPGLVHGSVRMMESCATLQYLGEQYPSPLYPTGQRVMTFFSGLLGRRRAWDRRLVTN